MFEVKPTNKRQRQTTLLKPSDFEAVKSYRPMTCSIG
jgi:hypothetical protein